MPMVNGHARKSASKADRWATCPGSVTFIERNQDKLEALGEVKAGDAAAIGTLCHKYGELQIKALNYKDEKDAEEYRVEASALRKDIPKEFRRNVDIYVEWCNDFLLGKDIPWGVETKFPLAHEPDSTGEADFWAIDKGTLIVVDYKSGRVKVDAEDNPQIAIYAIGAYEKLKHFYPNIQEVHVGIMQPFCYRSGVPVWWKMDVEKLMNLKRQIQAAADEVDNPLFAHRLVPSEKACRFCPAKPICPAHAADLLEMVPGVMNEPPEAIDGPTLFGILAKLKQFEDFLKKLKDYARELPEETLNKNGFEITPGRRTYSWRADPEELAQKLETLDVDAYRQVLRSPSDVLSEITDEKAAEEIEALVEQGFQRSGFKKRKVPTTEFTVSK